MGLETAAGIWQLNSSWPLGASDLKSQGDDHIRLIKAAILATFPNINAAVTVTDEALNAVQSAANLTSGTLADARVAASNVTQHEAAIGTEAATVSRVLRRDASGHIWAANLNSSAGDDTSGPFAQLVYRNGIDNYYRAASIANVERAAVLSWTIQSDPGGTPSGSPGQVFAYY